MDCNSNFQSTPSNLPFLAKNGQILKKRKNNSCKKDVTKKHIKNSDNSITKWRSYSVFHKMFNHERNNPVESQYTYSSITTEMLYEGPQSMNISVQVKFQPNLFFPLTFNYTNGLKFGLQPKLFLPVTVSVWAMVNLDIHILHMQ